MLITMNAAEVEVKKEHMRAIKCVLTQQTLNMLDETVDTASVIKLTVAHL